MREQAEDQEYIDMQKEQIHVLEQKEQQKQRRMKEKMLEAKRMIGRQIQIEQERKREQLEAEK